MAHELSMILGLQGVSTTTAMMKSILMSLNIGIEHFNHNAICTFKLVQLAAG